MSTNFPTALDALSNPAAGDVLNNGTTPHAAQHANANDAIEALQAKVGINSSAVATSLDYLVAQLNAYAAIKRPYILAQAAVPVCLAPNGTVATSGVVTLGTALPTTYSGGIWLRLPAGAVVAGSAGLYWAVMSSTTVGQVYTEFVDPASPFTPYIPGGTLTNATGSNVAYTQTTATDVTLVNVTLPGGAMGANGSFELSGMAGVPNNANSKVIRAKLGTFSFIASNAFASMLAHGFRKTVTNRGSQSIQVCASLNNATEFGTMGANSNTVGTQDLSVDVSATVAANMATATDFIIYDFVRFTVVPS